MSCTSCYRQVSGDSTLIYSDERELAGMVEACSELQAEVRTRRAVLGGPERCALRAAAQVEGYLEELLLLCQRSEEYNQFMLGKMQEAVAPKTLDASRENAFRCDQTLY